MISFPFLLVGITFYNKIINIFQKSPWFFFWWNSKAVFKTQGHWSQYFLLLEWLLLKKIENEIVGAIYDLPVKGQLFLK